MALPGLLIEYLVSGALALPWLLVVTGFKLQDVPNWQVPLFAVALYVIGMMVDSAAFALTRPAKWRLRKRVATKLGIEHRSAVGTAAARLVRLMKYSPEIAKEVSARSSRDRIARGAVLNAVISAVVLRNSIPWQISVLACVSLFGMWLFFEANSYVFELRADEAIKENERATANRLQPEGQSRAAHG